MSLVKTQIRIMNRLSVIFTFLAFLLIIGSCDNDDTNPSIESTMIGKWELKAYHNGQGGSEEYAIGNGKIIEFTLETYKHYEGGNLVKEGQYVIIRDQSILTGEKINRILYDSTADDMADHIRSVIEVNNNELLIYIDAFDGPSSEYQKIN